MHTYSPVTSSIAMQLYGLTIGSQHELTARGLRLARKHFTALEEPTTVRLLLRTVYPRTRGRHAPHSPTAFMRAMMDALFARELVRPVDLARASVASAPRVTLTMFDALFLAGCLAKHTALDANIIALRANGVTRL
ncbi:MAG: hypothetical protein Q7S96_03580 [bacterium]|nr:hypothetical protein [bacterium]